MEFKQLQYFVRVAELGGFSKAATALAVTQSALSKQIGRLEVELHQRLLLRDGRGVNLTEEGALFLSRAKNVIDQLEKAREELTSGKASPIGKVVLGTSPAAGVATITNVIAIFKQRFPQASLEIIEIKGWPIYEWLLMGRLDIGILYDPRPSPLIETSPLKQEDTFLISSASRARPRKSSSVKFSDLTKYPLILPSRQHTMRASLEMAAAKAGVKLDITLEVEGAPFILELVHQGHGYTMLPEHVVRESKLANKLQLNPLKPRLVRTLTMAVSSQRRATFLMQETVKLIKQCFESDKVLLQKK